MNEQTEKNVETPHGAASELSAGLGVSEKDMDTLENAQKRAEYWKAESMAATKEIELLRAQVAELADAFTVIWISDDRAAWDGKAVEHFDALLAKVGAGNTPTKRTYMPGSAICEHGYEAGKDCDVCYARWQAERHNGNK